jgi:hypothetical protein
VDQPLRHPDIECGYDRVPPGRSSRQLSSSSRLVTTGDLLCTARQRCERRHKRSKAKTHRPMASR